VFHLLVDEPKSNVPFVLGIISVFTFPQDTPSKVSASNPDPAPSLPECHGVYPSAPVTSPEVIPVIYPAPLVNWLLFVGMVGLF